MSRRLRLLVTLVAAAALAWLVLATLERGIALAQRFMDLPPGLRWIIGGVVVLLLCGGLAAGGWWLWPRKPRPAVRAPDRADLEARIARLEHDASPAGTEKLRDELHQLDQRRMTGDAYIAVFGDISTGKSALVRALVPEAVPPSDVIGGTTRTVTLYEGAAPAGGRWHVADVPGIAEADGQAVEALARDEALRAHAVVYVCAGDLTRTQARDVQWLGQFGKPLVLAINKADQWDASERSAIEGHVRMLAGHVPDAAVTVSAGGEEHFTRRLADGSTEDVRRRRPPEVAPLVQALQRVLADGVPALEEARQNAVLAGLHESTGELESQHRRAEADRIVSRYARRAVVGAMAAVAPGTDLVIQGALATGMVRALAELHGVRVADVDIDSLLREARVTLRGGTSVVLAIAGNALKAFPGLGTLGGGVLHAFAYALVFDSLGRAVAATLEQRHALDHVEASRQLRERLADASGGRLAQLARLTQDALRDAS